MYNFGVTHRNWKMAFLKKAFHSIRRGNEMSGTRSGEANFLQEKENPGAPRSAMAFTGTAFKCEGNGKNLARSQSIPFDGATLLDNAAERIATFLHGKDRINLGKTCNSGTMYLERTSCRKYLSRKSLGSKQISKPSQVRRWISKSSILNWQQAGNLQLLLKYSGWTVTTWKKSKTGRANLEKSSNSTQFVGCKLISSFQAYFRENMRWSGAWNSMERMWMAMESWSNSEQGQSKAVETNSVQSGRRMTLDEQNVAMELKNGPYTPWENSLSLLCVKYMWRLKEEWNFGLEGYHRIMQS